MIWVPIDRYSMRDADLLLALRKAGRSVLLASHWGILGLYSGHQIDPDGEGDGLVWFIDDSLFDGEELPAFYLVLPDLPGA